MKKRFLFIFAILLLLFSMNSCSILKKSEIGYLTQAAKGHFKIMNAREPIAKLLKKEDLDSLTRNQLELVLEIRKFASEELKLPQNKSYTRFAPIAEEYPGWNVYCAPEFSVEPVVWCYPIAGCVVYRGYFNKEDALQFAAEREKEGLDVHVGAFTGYSSLGWFNDPILSNHLEYDSIDLAGLIIHELAHQQLYIKNDSRFNEAFAVAVEREGTKRWLQLKGTPEQLAEAEKRWVDSDQRSSVVLQARENLEKIYAGAPTETLVAKKDSVFRDLVAQLRTIQNNGIPVEVDKSEKIQLNNASLVPTSTYHQLLPFFRESFDSLNRDFPAFYEYAKQLGKMKKELVY